MTISKGGPDRRQRQTRPEPLGWAEDMQPRYARYEPGTGVLIGTPSRNERTTPERRVASYRLAVQTMPYDKERGMRWYTDLILALRKEER